jgi:SNF2-related domain/Helicase conserved C-terminal domain/PLD-like domain
VSLRDLSLRGFYSAADDRLGEFYVPALSQAVAYDRMTGYFRSSALVVAAAGLSRFLANGGYMRLIVGADLGEDDVAAIEAGQTLSDVLASRLLAEPLEAYDVVAEHRLKTLGWLVREGRLQIRVGVPLDHLGRPLRRDLQRRYFHSKYGILGDADGNQVVFLGSDNESASGWRDNHETFTVAKSWLPEVWEEQGAWAVATFDAHWHGRPDLGWAIVDLPDALRDDLVARVVDDYEPPPARDPDEQTDEDPEGDRLRLAFVAAAPTLEGGTGVGYATTGVTPWPHQLAIARRAVDSYPRSYLLADEVGLGKTIEAGLILRELLVSGMASTALLLVPASVIRQWQEELAEKFALDVPRYDGQRFFDAIGEETGVPPGGSPWDAFPVVLATSHLARRRARRAQLLSSGPWDVVLVDEAHHAGRRGSKPEDPPNALLRTLQEMQARAKWQVLYLATATPMQMHAHEAWDLLALLGLTGRWGESSKRFTRYYEELREAFPVRQWRLLERMEADYFADSAAEADADLTQYVKDKLGLAGSNLIRKFHQNGLAQDAAREVPPETRLLMDEWLRRHTPMRDRVFRTTRNLLRHYKEVGILSASTTIPNRKVRDRFVKLRQPDEQALYDRVETYISRYYDAYRSGSGAQTPLGFIMTIYRRRLTSSFLAIERSLQRRLDVLVSNAAAANLLDDDDVAALEYTTMLDEPLPDTKRQLAAEVGELREFLAELAKREPNESKMTYLVDELNEAFRDVHDTVIVFTQYTDTMDYLRDQLVPVYGSRVACYSGRGGERYNPDLGEWYPVTKAKVKHLFREGSEVKIMLGTDALSEGLNLQTCGKLINYDMPWNFMRVEQRIGRIDRIGGRPTVDISNYFYAGTVEEQIYSGIGRDYDWFTDVVGPAAPVLGQVERAIEGTAMRAPGTERDAEVAVQVAEIRAAIEAAKARAVTVADAGAPSDGAADAAGAFVPAIDLDGLEQVLTRAAPTADHFAPHPSIGGAYLVRVDAAKYPVTFRRGVLDDAGPDVTLLTYGNPLLDDLLEEAGVAAEHLDAFDATSVRTLADLEQCLQEQAES